ncbi:MAG: TenA family transcriptional regulator [Dehalococcoidia bacterium]
MEKDSFWAELRREIQGQSIVKHPIYLDLVEGRLNRNTIAELCAQLKYTVTEGISSLSLIIPQAPRHVKKELAENLFGELAGTPEEPSHWELALRAGAAAGYSEEEVDFRPMLPETKAYPDTVSAYALIGGWLEALSFVSLGIEDMFTEFCDGVAKGLIEHFGYSDAQAAYFSVHVGADEAHAETGWKTVAEFATTEEGKQRVRRAALEGRNMWWNMYSAIYRMGEGKDAPVLRLQV